MESEKRAKLSAVTASPRKVLVERTALNLRELIEANIGAEVYVTETVTTNRYRATIAGVPEQSGSELEALSPPNAGPKLPVKGNVVLLKLAEGGVKHITLKKGQRMVGTSAMFLGVVADAGSLLMAIEGQHHRVDIEDQTAERMRQSGQVAPQSPHPAVAQRPRGRAAGASRTPRPADAAVTSFVDTDRST